MTCLFCGSTNVVQHGPFAGRILPGGDAPKLSDQLISYHCEDCKLIAYEKRLTSGVRAITSHITKEGRAENVKRVIVQFISDDPNEALIKEFYVWLTNIFVQDNYGLKDKAKDNDFLLAAILVAEQEYRRESDTPKHGGVDCRNKGGCKIVLNPYIYNYPTT